MVLRNQTSQSSRVRVEPFPASITFWLFSWNSKLKIKCETCGKGGIDYDIYIKHMEACLINKKISSVEELTKVVKEKETKIDELTAELDNLKINVLSVVV